MSDQDLVMPDFIFERRKDIELEAGFLLAGMLVTKFPQGRRLKGRDKSAIRNIIHKLGCEAEAGRLAENAVCYMWIGGKPANAVQTPIADDVMEKWVAKHVVIAVRVDARSSGTHLKIDSDTARMLGLGRTTH